MIQKIKSKYETVDFILTDFFLKICKMLENMMKDYSTENWEIAQDIWCLIFSAV